jgi:hypothetical protein
LVEPLLHFAVPFVTLRALGVDWKSSLFASLLALAPDLDVFLSVHRSFSHSAIVLLLLLIVPILMLGRNHRTIRNLTLLAAFAVTTHLVLDTFQTYTPLLWPLYDRSIQIDTSLNLHLGGTQSLIPSIAVQTEPTDFTSFKTFDAPLITAQGTGITIVLLTPFIIQILVNLRKARRLAADTH